jgi:hypothetical protein
MVVSSEVTAPLATSAQSARLISHSGQGSNSREDQTAHSSANPAQFLACVPVEPDAAPPGISRDRVIELSHNPVELRPFEERPEMSVIRDHALEAIASRLGSSRSIGPGHRRVRSLPSANFKVTQFRQREG